MNTLDKLKSRKSVKLFNGELISDKIIFDLVESCNLTPTSLGIQPVRLVVISSEEYKALLKPHSFYQPQIESCSHLFLFTVMNEISVEYIDSYLKLMSSKREVPLESLNGFKATLVKWFSNQTKEEYNSWAKNQAYLTLGSFLNTLAMENISGCAMEGFNPNAFDELLDLTSKNLSSVVICAVGIRSTECPRGKETKVRIDLSDYNPINFK